MLHRLQAYHLYSTVVILLTVVMSFALGAMSVRLGIASRANDRQDESLRRVRGELEALKRDVKLLKGR